GQYSRGGKRASNRAHRPRSFIGVGHRTQAKSSWALLRRAGPDRRAVDRSECHQPHRNPGTWALQWHAPGRNRGQLGGPARSSVEIEQGLSSRVAFSHSLGFVPSKNLALLVATAEPGSMPVRVCEMCKTGTIEAPGFSAASELERVVFDNRVILLCSEHRDLVDRARTRKLEELFELARQTPERRSLLRSEER